MSEVKKLIVSRKKKDQHGNEYALIQISSNQAKRPEIRVIKFKKCPKKSKNKLSNNEENSTTTKTYSSKPVNKENETTNREIKKKDLQSNLTDSSTTRKTKFNSFISNFNTTSKEKNFFIYKSPKKYIHLMNLNFIYPENINLSNAFHNKNKSEAKNNSKAYKTECTFGNEHFQKEFMKKREKFFHI